MKIGKNSKTKIYEIQKFNKLLTKRPATSVKSFPRNCLIGEGTYFKNNDFEKIAPQDPVRKSCYIADITFYSKKTNFSFAFPSLLISG